MNVGVDVDDEVGVIVLIWWNVFVDVGVDVDVDVTDKDDVEVAVWWIIFVIVEVGVIV